MKKSDLIPLKHVIVTRSRQVYWYVGDMLLTKKQCKSLYTNIDCDLDTWTNELVSIRDGSVYISENEPRLHDVIYVYKIVNMDKLIAVLRGTNYIKYPDYFNNSYSSGSWCKLVYERIDGEIEGDL